MYKLTVAYYCNTKASKKGYKWEYRGKIEDYKKNIEYWNECIKQRSMFGVKVTDVETNEIVFYKTKEEN